VCSSKRGKLIIFVVVSIFVLSVIYLYITAFSSDKQSLFSKIKSENLIFKYGIVLILNNDKYIDSIKYLSLLKNFISKFDNDYIRVFVYSKKPKLIRARIPQNDYLKIYNNNEKYDEQKVKDDHFYLFDINGSLIKSGDIPIIINDLLWIISRSISIPFKKWDPSEIVHFSENINLNEYLEFLTSNILRTGNKINVFVFLDNICSSCYSGMILNNINKLQERDTNRKYFVVLLSDYSQDDLNNIKKAERFDFEFIRSGKHIASYQHDMLEKDMISTINGLVLYIDKTNQVLYYYDCFGETNQVIEENLKLLSIYYLTEEKGNAYDK